MGEYTRDNETNAQSLDLYSVSECVGVSIDVDLFYWDIHLFVN